MSTLETASQLGRELRSICGAEYVVEDPGLLQRQAILGVAPAVAVSPASADEVVAVVLLANEHNLTVVPAGGCTQQQAGLAPPQIDILLNTARLTELEHYDPGDLTIGIGAGCTVAQLAAKVGADHLLFAGNPARPEQATIGGLLATGVAGPLRHGFGGLRDYCIGVKFVTGDGRKGKGGGRVVKNVAGFDLMKLLIGSRGTLAIITSASFKLFPAPRQTRSFVADFGSAAEALAFRDAVLRSPLSPICLEIVSPEAHSFWPEAAKTSAWSICIRAAGSDAVLARYRNELGSAVSQELDGQNEVELWRALSGFSSAYSDRYASSLVVSLSMPLRDVQSVLTTLASTAEANQLSVAVTGRVGLGHLIAGFAPTDNSDAAPANLARVFSALGSQLPRDASMVVLHNPPAAGDAIKSWLSTPTHVGSMRAVKQALDPKDILNRGRFLF